MRETGPQMDTFKNMARTMIELFSSALGTHKEGSEFSTGMDGWMLSDGDNG